ncbi:MAG: hypothetical protein ABI972_32050 [Acidobacteriota bacterium]
MQKSVAKIAIGLAVSAVLMFGADNSIGTWKRNIAKSKYTPAVANPVTSLTIVNSAAPGGVTTSVTGARKDGTPIKSDYTVKYDGKDYPVPGAPWDTVATKQVDANTFTAELKKTGGKYHAVTKMVISKDGKTMTLTAKGTNTEGQPMTGTYIYEKQ